MDEKNLIVYPIQGFDPILGGGGRVKILIVFPHFDTSL